MKHFLPRHAAAYRGVLSGATHFEAVRVHLPAAAYAVTSLRLFICTFHCRLLLSPLRRHAYESRLSAKAKMLGHVMGGYMSQAMIASAV